MKCNPFLACINYIILKNVTKINWPTVILLYYRKSVAAVVTGKINNTSLNLTANKQKFQVKQDQINLLSVLRGFSQGVAQ